MFHVFSYLFQVNNTLDRRIEAVARRQHGAFNRQQVLARGGSDRMVASRLSSGRWILLDRGVYALSSSPASWHRRASASTIGHPTAVLSGEAAAVLRGFRGYAKRRHQPLEVEVPHDCRYRSGMATVHRTRHLSLSQHDGIVCTSAAQTFLSVAPKLSFDEACLLFEDAHHKNLLTVDRIGSRLADLGRSPVRGRQLILAVLDRYGDGGQAIPASVLEHHVHTLLRRCPELVWLAEVAAPWRSAKTERVDILVPGARLIIEADGRRWHTRVADVANDQRRDHDAARHGYRTLRLGWEAIVGDPDGTLRLILIAAGLECPLETAIAGINPDTAHQNP